MDTKLKRYSILLKVGAFVLIAILACYMLVVLIDLFDLSKTATAFDATDLGAALYTDSRQYNDAHYNAQEAVDTIIAYTSERNILEGNAVSQADVDDQIAGLFEGYRYDLEQKFVDEGADTEDSAVQQKVYDRFLAEHKIEIEAVRNNLIQTQLEDFRNAVARLQDTSGLYYYLDTDGAIISNVDLDTAEKSEGVYENTSYKPVLEKDALAPESASSQQPQEVLSRGVIGFDEVYLDSMNVDFLRTQRIVKDDMIRALACLALGLLALGYLIFGAGKKESDPHDIHHVFIDGLYNELTAGLLIVSGYALVGCMYVTLKNLFDRVFMFALLIGSLLLLVAFLLALVRHIKSHTLLKHTLTFAILRLVFKAVKKVYDAGSPMIKAIVLVSAFGLLTAVPFMFLVTVPLALVFTYVQVTRYLALKQGIAQIRDGSYHEKIEMSGSGELAILTTGINDISSGLGAEVERRLKSERLKTELIVNVSHDIRTPLTSVIAYVDLLKQEDIRNKNAKKYIEVIASKSNRLKTLIDDLFDASKAASGSIAVDCAEMDIVALLTQGLGELDEKIKSSTLDFKVNLPEEKTLVYADGKLTWRVLENLLSNVLKYSLEHSRVYIDVYEDERDVCVLIKNISAQELNISEDELVERFTRGDESRSSEGSGLGLDIAQSLMRCQNGMLLIKIDGDLFKATVKLPKCG